MRSDIQIIRSKRKTLSLEIRRDEKIIVRAPMFVSDAEIEEFVSEHCAWIEKNLGKIQLQNEKKGNAVRLTDAEVSALKKEGEKIFRQRVEHFAPMAGVAYGKISVKIQKTLWGSCSAKGNLNFNCLLLLMPREVLDSVVVHELCHRRYMNHSKAFYDMVIGIYPEYRKWNEWLKKNGRAVLDRYF